MAFSTGTAHYQRAIADALPSLTERERVEVEELMRQDNGGVLDGLTRAQFRRAVVGAAAVIVEMRVSARSGDFFWASYLLERGLMTREEVDAIQDAAIAECGSDEAAHRARTARARGRARVS